MTLGKRIAKLRKEHGLLQKNLAGILGVSIGTVSNYEHDTHQPDLGVLVMMADYFSVSMDYLLGRTHLRNAIHCYNSDILDNGANLSAFLERWQSLRLEEQTEFIREQRRSETSTINKEKAQMNENRL